MILGIVGVEEKKLTPETKEKARGIIRGLFADLGVTGVSSGRCHLGGIDIVAEEEAARAGLEGFWYPPKSLDWSNGYKPRNIQIAEKSDAVVCLSVRVLPEGYDGMRFLYCYHCGTKDHIKSGGCWTTKYARKLGKKGWTIVL